MKKTAVVVFGLTLVLLVLWSLQPSKSLPVGATADLVVIHKAARRLDLYENGSLLKSYAVSLGRHPIGPKQRQGDGRTPEGQYRIDYRNPNSAFYRALHISYPNDADIAAARAHGADPGGLVMIHGMRNGLGWIGRLHLAVNWTNGCVAVTDREMDEIWRAVPDGAKVIIKP
jgi:murein L,D-transpeptidase YafK